jgi:hypothetical protein
LRRAGPIMKFILSHRFALRASLGFAKPALAGYEKDSQKNRSVLCQICLALP